MIDKKTLKLIGKLKQLGDVKKIKETTGFTERQISYTIKTGRGDAEDAVSAFYMARAESMNRRKKKFQTLTA